jgi:ribonuclease BN (tRNA processing enzyme)
MKYVGDGLSMSLVADPRVRFHIDCGGTFMELAAKSLIRTSPNVFILSHFHYDHYNGLLYLNRNGVYSNILDLDNVYFPRIPELIYDGRDQSRVFMFALLTANSLIFSSETGIMEYDFLRCIQYLNSKPFRYHPVSKGDTITYAGEKFDVLWPPRRVYTKRIIMKVMNALERFHEAIEKDDRARNLYERIIEEKVAERLFKEGGLSPYDLEHRNEISKAKQSIRAETIRASKGLIRVANDLCMIFNSDDEILFLGDSERFELNNVISELHDSGMLKFSIMVAPHHGTHWSRSMYELRPTYTLVSNGPSLVQKFRRELLDISNHVLSTFHNGTIVLSRQSFLDYWFSVPSSYLPACG